MFDRKNKKTTTPSPLFSAIARRINEIQKRLASWLHNKTKHWSKGQQKVFLLIICLVMGGLSTNCIIQVFYKSKSEKAFPLLSIPATISPPIVPPDVPMYLEQDTLVFSQFRQLVDSLLKSPDGRKQYENFIRERPGFMDSLAFAEKILKQSFPHY